MCEDQVAVGQPGAGSNKEKENAIYQTIDAAEALSGYTQTAGDDAVEDIRENGDAETKDEAEIGVAIHRIQEQDRAKEQAQENQ